MEIEVGLLCWLSEATGEIKTFNMKGICGIHLIMRQVSGGTRVEMRGDNSRIQSERKSGRRDDVYIYMFHSRTGHPQMVRARFCCESAQFFPILLEVTPELGPLFQVSFLCY
jgi:hypothetical protein